MRTRVWVDLPRCCRFHVTDCGRLRAVLLSFGHPLCTRLEGGEAGVELVACGVRGGGLGCGARRSAAVGSARS